MNNPTSDSRHVRPSTPAFTLVEMLVVITIIIVLLSLLTPAMDRAMYVAELTTCAARLKAIATGVTAYASGNGRAYPYRPTLQPGATWRRPNCIYDTQFGLDDRPYFRDSFPSNTLLDPLCGKIDLRNTPPGNYVFSNYELWFGMSFATANGGRGLLRLGDRLEWKDNSRGAVYDGRFDVLASEEDLIEPSYNYRSCVSHPDVEGLTRPEVHNGGGYILSRWVLYSEVPVAVPRGPIDANFACADGSVIRIDNVLWNDDRMARVPLNADATPNDVGTGHWIHLPR